MFNNPINKIDPSGLGESGPDFPDPDTSMTPGQQSCFANCMIGQLVGHGFLEWVLEAGPESYADYTAKIDIFNGGPSQFSSILKRGAKAISIIGYIVLINEANDCAARCNNNQNNQCKK